MSLQIRSPLDESELALEVVEFEVIFGEGNAVGAGEGSAVGLSEGDPVGLPEGNPDVGGSVTLSEGNAVGVIVGACVA